MPNIVGVDIGCGMYTVRLNAGSIDFSAVDAAAHAIPSGLDVWDEPKEAFDLTGLRCYEHLSHIGRLEKSLGTLGGGNHFIEIDRASDDTFYLVIHSGSRNLGKQVAEYYQHLAIDQNRAMDHYQERRHALIAEYKAAGRSREKDLGTVLPGPAAGYGDVQHGKFTCRRCRRDRTKDSENAN